MSKPLLRRTGVRAALALTAAGGVVAAGGHLNTSRHRLKAPPDSVAARAQPDANGVVRTDVLVVGSGAAALTAALRARSLGLETLVVEKADKIGGTSCYSGAGLWIPNSRFHRGNGDTVEAALTYMEHVAGEDPGPASSRERKLAFLHAGPEMVDWLASQGYRWADSPKYPDYLSWLPGGRCIQAGLFNVRLLGPQWRDRLNLATIGPLMGGFADEVAKTVRYPTSLDCYVLASGRFLPRVPIPKADLDSGFVTMADSLDELAAKMGIDPAGLRATVDRFNGFVDQGVDKDFARGSTPYDAYMSDPAYKKNPSLGRIEKAPFYCMRMYPGDLGTKGGILTDEHGQALRETTKKGGGGGGQQQYEPVPGLYAAGNSSASVMGRGYAGAGATLGPAMTFAYLAATDCAKQK